ncbi:MAG: plasmid stabilization protein [Phycisphaerales bacterium]|nr:plasmid stabilization protein [Phycisphaerales bacterium]
MARGSKEKYSDKQKRKAEHIEEGYEKRGVPDPEAERRAWATVNKQEGGGKKAGSGRKGSTTASKSRTRSASAKSGGTRSARGKSAGSKSKSGTSSGSRSTSGRSTASRSKSRSAR